MAKIDLASKDWIELIFEGRNKAYGAYRLRADAPKRNSIALILVIVFAALALSIPKLIEIATPDRVIDETMVDVTALSALKEVDIPEEKIERVQDLAPPPPPLKSTLIFVPPAIVEDSKVTDKDAVTTQDEATKSNLTLSNQTIEGNDDKDGKILADIKEKIVKKEEPKEKEEIHVAVEQMPEFPGGMSALMSFIGKELKYPTISAENGTQGKVTVRFVVDKTGKVGSIQVIKSLDAHCDKEAIRVISMMPKWIPGKQNGTNVSVYYVVPISFKLNN